MASFYHTIANPDDLVKCPYDPVHMIRMKKIPYHLMKCRKNFPNRQMAHCPFNAGHLVPEAELRFHMNSCPDKHAMQLLHKDHTRETEGWVKGNTDVPTYFPEIIPDSGEDWGSENTVPRIGVQARDVAGIGYHKSLVGLQKSQKKAYYENIRRGDIEANVQLFEDLNMVAAEDEGTPAVTSSLPSASASFPTSQQQASIVTPFAQPTLGRGRGTRAAKAEVTPGAAQAPEESIDELKRLARKTKKKLKQIAQLLERQASGEPLNEEEKMKVAHKTTFDFKLKTILAQVDAAEKQQGPCGDASTNTCHDLC